MRKYFTTNRDPYVCPSHGLFAVATGVLPTRLAIVVIPAVVIRCEQLSDDLHRNPGSEGVFQRLKRLGFYDGPTRRLDRGSRV